MPTGRAFVHLRLGRAPLKPEVRQLVCKLSGKKQKKKRLEHIPVLMLYSASFSSLGYDMLRDQGRFCIQRTRQQNPATPTGYKDCDSARVVQ